MSSWTHVAGVIRVNDIRTNDYTPRDWDKEIGRECLFEDPEELWDEAEVTPDDFLPMGSEGTLQKSIWENPDKACMAAYTITIFGDLRDHYDPQSIVDWFKEKCSKLAVRQACITVYSGSNGTVNWVYDND